MTIGQTIRQYRLGRTKKPLSKMSSKEIIRYIAFIKGPENVAKTKVAKEFIHNAEKYLNKGKCMNLGQLVRDAREKQNMTQLELSRKLGYGSMQFVSLFERGLSKIPLKTLGKLIVILSLPEKKIVGELIKKGTAAILEEIKEGKSEQR